MSKEADVWCGAALQTITGLKALLNPNGAATPNYISAFDNYDTALAFVQALGHSQDNNGDTNTVCSLPRISWTPCQHPVNASTGRAFTAWRQCLKTVWHRLQLSRSIEVSPGYSCAEKGIEV